MARMLPEFPRTLSADSLENVMFEALERLPEEYFVVHSFRLVTVEGGMVKESETDFLVFNPEKGIICIEAKAGHIKYENGEWLYGSGVRMSHDGPYNQASSNKWRLKDYFLSTRCESLLRKCKLLHAVWFPSITDEELKTIKLPPEADKAITLTKSDLANPQIKLDSIFSLSVSSGIETKLSRTESETIISRIICPTFELVPSVSMSHDLRKQVFHKMLTEQKHILDFLVDQKSAIIQGVAGTGKTMIALEKARRHADKGEKVLYLCYNRYLKDYINDNNSNELIDYFTIDGFACSICQSPSPDYRLLKTKLESMFFNNAFPYKHIIIDEGQDFGQEDIEKHDILITLETIVLDESINGSFYIFYDAMQFIQGSCIPKVLEMADCKLTLYKNCRNTENIAITSMKPLKVDKPILIDGCVKGTIPKLYFDSDESPYTIVEEIIKEYLSLGIRDIVILTCKTENMTELKEKVDNGLYDGKYKFSTCRKFKGLEADAIIIVDVDKTILTNESAKIFYVGASRARLYLSLVCNMDDSDCNEVLSANNIRVKNNKAKKQLATLINSVYQK